MAIKKINSDAGTW